jgi:hypothetical protein
MTPEGGTGEPGVHDGGINLLDEILVSQRFWSREPRDGTIGGSGDASIVLGVDWWARKGTRLRVSSERIRSSRRPLWL